MNRLPHIVMLFLFLQTGKSNAQSWKQYSDSALGFQQQRNNARALDYFQKAGEILEKDSAGTVSYFYNLNSIGDVCLDMGQYPKAEPFYTSGKELIEKLQGKENANYALSCYNLGRLYRLMGQDRKSVV